MFDKDYLKVYSSTSNNRRYPKKQRRILIDRIFYSNLLYRASCEGMVFRAGEREGELEHSIRFITQRKRLLHVSESIVPLHVIFIYLFIIASSDRKISFLRCFFGGNFSLKQKKIHIIQKSLWAVSNSKIRRCISFYGKPEKKIFDISHSDKFKEKTFTKSHRNLR